MDGNYFEVRLTSGTCKLSKSYAPEFQSSLWSLTACLSMFRTVSRYDQPSPSAASAVNAAWASLPGLPGPVMFGFMLISKSANSASFPVLVVSHDAPKNTKEHVPNFA
jgi:hypothetical protein